jgi:hypothetical protein
MVVRKKSTDSWTEPNQGTAYSAGNSIGSGTVVYNGSGTSYQNTGLTSSTSYDYKFYSVNNDYYSAGSITNASTASLSSDYFRSKTTGSWNSNSTWESSNNNSDWVNSTITPTTTNVAILSSHTVSITENLSISSLTINSGGIVEVNAAKQLTVNTALTNNGTLTLKSADGVGTATIKTPETISGSGTYNVEQYLGSARNWYLTSPLTNAVTSSLIHYKYLENGSNSGYTSPATAYWANVPTSTQMIPALGYIAQATSATTYTFTTSTGRLNNGNITTLTLTRTPAKSGYNLIGNPYPSYLDINSFSSSSLIEATYWIRSNNSGYVFDTYNIPSNLSTGLSGKTVSRYIPPMQAFWVKLKADQSSGTLQFTNLMRAHADDAGNTFRAPAQSVNKIARLEVKTNNNVDETLIYFNPNALNSFDDYDSQKKFNDEAGSPEIYTFTDSKNLVINGFNDITLNTEIPLGFRTGITTEGQSYTLKATQLLNFDSNVEMVLVDKQNSGSETVLNEGVEFTFTSDVVNTTSRFSLAFRTKGSTTGGCCYGIFENNVRIQKNESNQIVVNCDNAVLKNATVAVYNTAGQKLMQQNIQSSTTILSSAFKAGVYLVKLQSEGKTYHVKVSI